MLGALVTVFSTWATADCAGEPALGAGLVGVLLEVAGAGAELTVEFEDPDAAVDPALGLAVDVGAVEPLEEDDELGVDVPLGVCLEGAACPWAGELTTPAPAVARPGAPAATEAEFAPRAPLTGGDPVGAPVATRTGPDAGR